MARSIGFATYRALSRRASERRFKPTGPRPDGALLWIHAAEPGNMLAILDLAQRLCAARPGLHVLITLPDRQSYDAAVENEVPHGAIQLACVPSEHPDAVEGFWAHWKPDLVIWAWGHLRPNLLDQVHAHRCPALLIDADAEGFEQKAEWWFSSMTRQGLTPFAALLARSDAGARRLQKLGIPEARIDTTPPLQAGGQALPCQDSDLTALSDCLRGRPVWLASNLQDDEVDAVLNAHRLAARMYHQLLLVLHPADAALAETCAQKMTDAGYRMADWSSGAEPDDATQVLLVADPHELGLFYRVAPVSFLGSSLVQGYGGCNPFDAAALGSAVLYGPNVRRFMPFYARLAQAGAGRIVKDGETLGTAVARLIAPDHAAAMAHAGWDVISQGADLTDRVIDLVHAALDGELEPHHART